MYSEYLYSLRASSKKGSSNPIGLLWFGALGFGCRAQGLQIGFGLFCGDLGGGGSSKLKVSRHMLPRSVPERVPSAHAVGLCRMSGHFRLLRTETRHTPPLNPRTFGLTGSLPALRLGPVRIRVALLGVWGSRESGVQEAG